jgi:hypothetical protein
MATDGENPRAETHSGRLGVHPREVVDALEGSEPVEGAWNAIGMILEAV